jgi:hypothetical protein
MHSDDDDGRGDEYLQERGSSETIGSVNTTD